MPRYFYNLPGSPTPDDKVGVLLAGPEEARSQAVVAAGEMLKDIDGGFWSGPEWRMHVTDHEGSTVCMLRIEGSMPS